VVAAAVVAATVAVGGCSRPLDKTAGSDRRADHLGVVTYSGYALPEAPAQAFQAANGMKVTLVASEDAGAALTKAIATSGHPEGDVFFGIDTTFLGRAEQSNAFVKIDTTGLPDDVTARIEGDGRFVPVDESTVCIDYDSQWFTAKKLAPPTSFEDLADAKYKDLTVVLDPALSSPGLVFLAATRQHFGDGAEAYWKRLRANGVEVAAGWSDAWNSRYSGTAGNRPIVLSYASSPPAELDPANPNSVPRTAVVESTCARQVEYVAVLRGAASPKEARALVAAMLSTEWQAALPESNYVFPIRRDVALPAAFGKFAVRPARPIEIDRTQLDAQRDAWIETWRGVFG
jgi:thiamine transport system substrate-binding protein